MSAGSKWYTERGYVGYTTWVKPEFRERINQAIRKKSFEEGRNITQREFFEAALTAYMELLDA